MIWPHDQIVDELISNNGFCSVGFGELAIKIVEFTNINDERTCGIVFANDRNPYAFETETIYVKNPVILWKHQDFDEYVNV